MEGAEDWGEGLGGEHSLSAKSDTNVKLSPSGGCKEYLTELE